MLPRPHALLLDFGGVIADAPDQPWQPSELVSRVQAVVDHAVPAERIRADLATGDRAYAAWRDEVGSEDRPADLPHAEVWQRFVTPGWPALAREAVRREATGLAYVWTRNPAWALRPGIPAVLAASAAEGIPVTVVSNTLCGAAHRDFLAAVGVADRFVAQFYSDEELIRKPNPELAWRAARAVDVPIESCWFVGDSLLRDIACARRAGTAAAILMRSPRTDREPPAPGLAPDATIDDGYGLLDLVTGSIRQHGK